ncbi:MAG: hypothetical protein ACREO1_16325 [Arenimonas sp.]
MTLEQICIGLLVLAILLGSTRYLFSLRRMQVERRPQLWRVLMILALQVSSAALLYFVLFPPPTFTSAERLVILTANANTVDHEINGRVIALPEAPASANAEAVPDLATALRRYPGVNFVQVVGAGLTARDQDAARGVSIAFDPAPLPKGLVELSLPDNVSSGARWSLQGRVNQIKNARVELLDPGNAVVASAQTDADGFFVVSDTARTAGMAMYQLRILDEQKTVVETVKLPLNIVQEKTLKVLSLSGGPSPDLKYLRRWAVDAGIDLQSQINLSPGVQMNNAAISINSSSLRDLDLLMLDERAWGSMGRGSKQAVIEALRGGMGVLLRITGPLSANDRSELRALGFAVSDANIVQGIRLNSSKDSTSLTRRPLRVGSSDAVTLLQDDAKNPLALWRAEGRGRIGLFWLTDSYKLVLNDEASRHGQIWRDAFSFLARVRSGSAITLRDQGSRVNRRNVMCNLGAKSFVQAADSGITYLIAETTGENKNCAAFWPRVSGWHVVVSDANELPLYVRGQNEAPGLQANAVREATLLLTAKQADEKNTSRIPVPGSPWSWFSAWFVITTVLWLLERSKIGIR